MADLTWADKMDKMLKELKEKKKALPSPDPAHDKTNTS